MNSHPRFSGRTLLPLLLPACLGWLASPAHAAAPTSRDLAAWLQPDRTQQATLAPDGHHLAYTVHEEELTMIVIIDVDDPTKKAVLPVGRDVVIRDSRDHEKSPMRVPFFRWVGPGRLVFAAEMPSLDEVDVRRVHEPANVTVVYAVDADGRHLMKLADEENLVLLFPLPDGSTERLPRQPRVIDLAADVQDSILVEAVRPALGSGSADPSLYGRVATGLFRINVRTGQRQVLHEQDVNGRLLYDRNGQARIEIWDPIDRAGQSFISLPSPGRRASKELDKLFGDAVTPANYLGTRTFPVGFDYDPDILYLASNAGRDTYGLYALDLRTAKRTALAVEHPAFDLAGFETSGSLPALVFDQKQRRLVGVRVAGLEPAAQWLDPELAGLQATLDGKFPGRSVQLIDWDDSRTRFLVFASSVGDPGRYYLYHRAENRLVQIVRRAPAVDPDQTNAATTFAFDTPEGVHLTGYLTVPKTPLKTQPPLLVWCHDGPWDRDAPGFNHDAQMFAAMGFFVLQVNYRGSAGFGTRFREALRESLDGIPVADIRAAITWVEARYNVDRKRVALLGQGFGGYLALRALQLYPDDFRCAVAINAPTDLEQWSRKPESWREAIDRGEVANSTMKQTQDFMINFGPGQSGPLAQRGLLVPSFAEQGMGALDAAPSTNGDPDPVSGTQPDAAGTAAAPATAGGRGGPPPPPFPPEYVNFASELRRWYFGHDKARLAALSPAQHPELFTKPVLLLQDPYDAGGEAGVSSALRSALSKAGNPPEYLEISGEFTRGLPKARLQAWTKVQEFMMISLYDFDVKIGIPKVQK